MHNTVQTGYHRRTALCFGGNRSLCCGKLGTKPATIRAFAVQNTHSVPTLLPSLLPSLLHTSDPWLATGLMGCCVHPYTHCRIASVRSPVKLIGKDLSLVLAYEDGHVSICVFSRENDGEFIGKSCSDSNESTVHWTSAIALPPCVNAYCRTLSPMIRTLP